MSKEKEEITPVDIEETEVIIDEHSRLVEDESLEEEDSHALDLAFSHFIKERNGNPIPFAKLEKSCLFAEFLGGSGGIYILPIVREYTKDMPPALAWNFILTNPLSNVMFLINAADGLFDSFIRDVNPPSALKGIIVPPSKKELLAKYLKMAVGSLICSIPFGAATYLFPLQGCEHEACKALTVTHTLVSNTILHAISWDILLKPENWVYRLPTMPIELAFQYAKKALRSDASNQMIESEGQQEVIFQKYRNLVNQGFARSTQGIIGDYLINHHTHGGFQAETFIEYIGRHPANSLVVQNSPCQQYLSQINYFIRNYMILLLGAFLTILAGLGWEANPFYLGLQEHLSLPLTILAGVLPSYSTVVLFAFYGAMVGGEIYDYLTNWNGIRSKFSHEAQLYPKTFAIFLIINVYIAVFAFAGAEQLIRTVFGAEIWDAYRPYLEYETMPVFQLLSFVPLLNLFNIFMRKTMAKFGGEGDDAQAARLLEKANVMMAHMQHIDGAKLMKSLAKYDDRQLSALGIDAEEFKKDMQAFEGLKESINRFSSLHERPSVQGSGNRYLMWQSEHGSRNENNEASVRIEMK